MADSRGGKLKLDVKGEEREYLEECHMLLVIFLLFFFFFNVHDSLTEISLWEKTQKKKK